MNPDTALPAGAAPGKHEIVLRGMPASGGIAIGPAFVYEREEVYVTERTLSEEETGLELDLLRDAFTRARRELLKIAEYARTQLSEEAAEIFESQLMMLKDPVLVRSLETRIQQERKNADFLIHHEIEKYKALLGATDDPLFRERMTDLDEIAQRLLRSLQKKRLRATVEGRHIIVAASLTPADSILFSRSDVLGYAIDTGGITSHTAILARSLKIPSVVAIHEATRHISTGDLLILDGQRGLLFIYPTAERIAEYRQKIHRIEELEESLKGLVDLPCVTPDGHAVEISANAEFVNECDYILAQGGNGIGLYRTEHLYILEGEFPSEQEQFVAYSSIAQSMYPRPVIIRTFDIGGDKFLQDRQAEENPSLGWRGIRVMLDMPDIFKQQLRAILRASTTRNIKLMFPMISGLVELRVARKHLNDARAELREQGVPFDEHMQVGMMIEVPSSVMLADIFAKEVDFFSIGTNDLIQYLLAVDRNNDLITDLYQEFHPSVLRAIRHVVNTAHEAGIWAGVCGEMAGNPMSSVLLLGLGLDELSMVPSVIPTVKEIIRSTSFEEARRFTDTVLAMATATETKTCVAEYMRVRYPDFFTPVQNGDTCPILGLG
ncbi:MAG: phosphoenolpyruvate--protein phosphotransferase [Ignavibacteria bacterium]|nr:phosphoenolpyruvate--protein phosphotransferase [Ignavibacteria bacterium]